MGGDWVWIDLIYERLPTFCFICGIIGHLDRNCPSLYEKEAGEINKQFCSWLRAQHRRHNQSSGERWLRESLITLNRGEEGSSEVVRQQALVTRNDVAPIMCEKSKGHNSKGSAMQITLETVATKPNDYTNDTIMKEAKGPPILI